MPTRTQETARSRVEARLTRIANELDSPAIREALALLKSLGETTTTTTTSNGDKP